MKEKQEKIFISTKIKLLVFLYFHILNDDDTILTTTKAGGTLETEVSVTLKRRLVDAVDKENKT